MQITMPKWLRRNTVAEKSADQIRDDEEALYGAELRQEEAAHAIAFYKARIARLKERSAAHVVVQFNPHRH